MCPKEPEGLSDFLNTQRSPQDSMYGYADGGAVEPDGLDEFLSEPKTAEPISVNEPPGLNEFLGNEVNNEQYGTPEQQGITALEGVGRGVAGPFSTMAETAMGVDPTAILARQNTNPLAAGAGEVTGLAGSMLVGTGEGALVAKLGSKAAEIMGLGGKAATLASKIGGMAADSAVQSALVSGSDSVSKMMLNDPNTSAQTAIADAGLSGAIGAGIGGALGVVSPLFKAVAGDKIAQMIEDFKGRLHDHVVNPDPVKAVTDELQNHYTNIKSLADDVYGPTGLKAQDIAKSMPPQSPEMITQAQNIGEKLRNTVQEMTSSPNRYPPRLASKLQDDLVNYQSALSSAKDPADIFNAAQDLKQQLQGYSKYDKFVKPVDEAYDFVSKAKGLAYDVRSALEDPDVWGKAADRQQAINTAFKEYLPSLQDFEKRFTTKVSGEPEIDPAKINTYINQLGKPNAEIKQKMLQNFLDASDKYKQVINQSHINLGLDAPNLSSPLNVTQSTLGKKTAGAKLADIFINKGLRDAGGKTIGAGVGAALGVAAGSPGMGALVGEHALGPFFNSVLPALAKPMLESMGNPAGLKSATDYALSVAAGDHLADRATKAIFSSTRDVLNQREYPKEDERIRLDKKLKEYAINPDQMSNIGGDLAHYMPNHATALGQTIGQAVSYLNNLRPSKNKASPLDNEPIISDVQRAKYNNALNIAQQPMLVLDKIKSGRITLDDIHAIQNMYPSLYKNLSQKLVDQVTTEVAKGKEIPYKIKSSISMFLGQPLDSTMKPESIQAAQSIGVNNQQPQPNPAQAGGRKKGSPKALTKFGQMYQTPLQAANADKSSRQE